MRILDEQSHYLDDVVVEFLSGCQLVRKELRAVTDVTQAAILSLQIQNYEQLKKATYYTAFPLTCEVPLRFKLIQHSEGCAN